MLGIEWNAEQISGLLVHLVILLAALVNLFIQHRKIKRHNND